MPSSKPFDWNSWVAYVFPLKAVNMNFPAHEEIIWKMTAILADNVEEEYLWAISLTSANKVEQLSTQTKPWTRCIGLCLGPQRACRSWWWSACQSQACVRYLSQFPFSTSRLFLKKDFTSFARLLIKTAILMPEAQDGEVTIVEVESLGYNKAKVIGMIQLLLQQGQSNLDDLMNFYWNPLR